MTGRCLKGMLAVCAGVLSLAFASVARADNYVVLYKQQAVPASAAADIQSAGGKLVYRYGQIGVAVARSDSDSFASRLGRDSRIEGVSSTAAFATRLSDDASASSSDASGPPPGDLANESATDADTFSPLQWDMRQIHAPEAHAITGGSPEVVVGDIDSGLDYTHPDLAQNVDFSRSVSCVGGVPDQDPAAWKDDNGHGTHTAGTIAAADNGFGIVGVAPNVKIAGIKTSTPAGFFYPENVVCAFVWAGTHGIDVTNNSYFADPFLFNCRNDPTQRAIWKAEKRAIQFAMNRGVTVVAAAGNESEDLSHPTMDTTSPDDTTPEEREINNACVVIPVEIPGVVGVSATGADEQDTSAGQYPDNLKSYYSSFGVSAVDVTAPGGDRIFGVRPQQGAVNGRVLSTWASDQPCSAALTLHDPAVPTALYCYAQGTSMASPHVAGIAALIVSRYGDASSPQNGKMRPGQVAALISRTADPQACPNTLPTGYELITGTQSGTPQQCQGGPGHNSWYGTGQADALNAVTAASGSRG